MKKQLSSFSRAGSFSRKIMFVLSLVLAVAMVGSALGVYSLQRVYAGLALPSRWMICGMVGRGGGGPGSA
ncbi:hypothetical protein [Rhodoferax sp.]|uniref:hypothetical protein n=1 Tax=Rhodoferax sp. TaxID=50421 RepID=UPI00374DC539